MAKYKSKSMKLVLFDMDGTIIDPKLGFVRCINYALNAMDEEPVPESELVQYIGPPLDYAFKNIVTNCSDDFVMKCVAKYRERYLDIGWQENHLYQGIDKILQTLQADNYTLAICTSRRTDLALKIINFYGYNSIFSEVYGADIGVKKSTLVENLITQKKFTADSWLIGDRSFDINAAKLNGLHSIAVLWGYGSKQELENCSPDFYVSKPNEIIGIIKNHF
ncbi:MAG: HAD family hydrolase [Thiohalomonadales bacterium]